EAAPGGPPGRPPLPRPLHASRGDHQLTAARLRPWQGDLPLEGLPARESAARADPRRGRVSPTLAPPRAASGVPTDPALRVFGQWCPPGQALPLSTYPGAGRGTWRGGQPYGRDNHGPITAPLPPAGVSGVPSRADAGARNLVSPAPAAGRYASLVRLR